ncbi:hypothetical protein MUK42_16799 [Musa troglodytarum]|uniref:Uncharacterized protein n=1 Tax=Musa troglodytarum TaxID=320322 RepID=A0A9E7HFD2_9LILI|nr:hypothetical protein MUK42_16799 [Musa troglodytarum]
MSSSPTSQTIANSSAASSFSPFSMASSSHRPCLPLLLLLLHLSLSSFSQLALAARGATANSEEKIPWFFGRVLPWLRNVDHSGSAAANSRYLPGNDDTFVPNPGFETPNRFRGRIP